MSEKKVKVKSKRNEGKHVGFLTVRTSPGKIFGSSEYRLDMSSINADNKIKRHSIHGMNDEEDVIRPHQEMEQLTLNEKKFLLAVERGDLATTRRMLQRAQEMGINVNCVDPLGRSALLMAIDNENLKMVELLLAYKVDTKDALLHAISEEFVEAVEVLLNHEETVYKHGELHSWEALPPDTATFTPDITPLILAAHRDNYEIIKILLDRGSSLPIPHDVRCGCDDCVTSRCEDSLRHSRSRINAYRALASPSLIALSSKDPILTAFELSWELRRLSFLEHEFKTEYQELRKQCQNFATALLDHTRSSYELEVLLNHDLSGPVYEHGERMHLNRLKLAIKLRQKKFVSHSNVQQLLASIWYEGLPGFRRKNMFLQALDIIRIGFLFPFFSISYILAPRSIMGQKMRQPFIKFICHSASYFTFLFMLILASQRIESVISMLKWNNIGTTNYEVPPKRGSEPTIIEWLIFAWVGGLIWSEVKQLWDVGLEDYVHDMWNVIDFITNSLYVATISLRIVSYYQVQKELITNPNVMSIKREEWDAWDPMLISEGLFSTANIFSSLKLVYIFSVNPHLGPLQVSLSRMVMDIMKFFFLYVLVLFAFSCGLNQLLWYYADLEKKRCPIENANISNITDQNACVVWRRFANLFETTQTLFWAVFGLIDLESFELAGIKIFTRFWGMLMFGTYSVINIVVLLNLLIAMMNHSYQLISERADIEWKFARSKLWISYFEEGGTVPPPFNIIPTPKSIWYTTDWLRKFICSYSGTARKEHIKTIRRKVKQATERDFRYQTIMRNLVRRYVTVEQRNAEHQGVTEDDVNEIKQDISSFRCELIEILKNSGMNTSISNSITSTVASGGKKNRQKERRLMKGFNIVPQPSISAQLPPVAELMASFQSSEENVNSNLFASTLSEFFTNSPVFMNRKLPFQPHTISTSQNSICDSIKIANTKTLAKRSTSYKKKWDTLIEVARTGRMSKLIGRSKSEDSVCDSGNYISDSENLSDSVAKIKSNNADNQKPLRKSTSPILEDSFTESNQSVDLRKNFEQNYSLGALAALRRKRKKFSASRNQNAVIFPPSIKDRFIFSNKLDKKTLKRAASVPTKVAEVVQIVMTNRQDQMQSQQQSCDTNHSETILHSSVDEQKASSRINGFCTSSREQLMNTSSSTQCTGSIQTPDDESKTNNSDYCEIFDKLAGIIPVNSGHQCLTDWI